LLLLLLPIGDTLFATPTVRALRRAYPQAHMVALAYPSNAGILEANPDIDRLLLHPTGATWPGWRGYGALLWRLNRRRFDLVVQFGPAQWWLTQAIRPRRRRRLAFPLWQWFIPLGPRPWRYRHAVSSYATLLTPREREYLPGSPVLSCSPADRARAAELLAWADGAPLIAFHPGGEGFRGMKRWPLGRFVAAARALTARHGAGAVVLGGADEIGLAEALAAGVPGCRSLAGQLNLGQTVAVLERCMLFVGNDSAPMHMAAAIGVPTVGIFGPTSPLNFRPRGPRVAVVRAGLGCSPCFHFVGSHALWTGSRCRVPSCLHAIAPGAVVDAATTLVERADRSAAALSRQPGLARPGAGYTLFGRYDARPRSAGVAEGEWHGGPGYRP
jgi:ADP-heptose:LPS heptosyltransferase